MLLLYWLFDAFLLLMYFLFLLHEVCYWIKDKHLVVNRKRFCHYSWKVDPLMINLILFLHSSCRNNICFSKDFISLSDGSAGISLSYFCNKSFFKTLTSAKNDFFRFLISSINAVLRFSNLIKFLTSTNLL